MKYYYLVNGKIIDKYNISAVNRRFEDIKRSSERKNTLSWYRTSEDIKVLNTIDSIHVFCTEEHLNEFKNK